MPNAGIMASWVSATAVDALMEPFNNYTFAPWTLFGSPTIVAGRNGNGASIGAATGRADYTIPSPSRSKTLTLGFAWRTNTSSTSVRQVVSLWSDANGNESIRVSYDGTTAQTFTITRLGLNAVGTTIALVPVNTYAYLELQAVCDDTAGSVIFRVNGVERLNVGGMDTAPTPGAGLVDTIRLGPLLSAHTNVYDDLYLTMGAGAPFKGDIIVP